MTEISPPYEERFYFGWSNPKAVFGTPSSDALHTFGIPATKWRYSDMQWPDVFWFDAETWKKEWGLNYKWINPVSDEIPHKIDRLGFFQAPRQLHSLRSRSRWALSHLRKTRKDTHPDCIVLILMRDGRYYRVELIIPMLEEFVNPTQGDV